MSSQSKYQTCYRHSDMLYCGTACGSEWCPSVHGLVPSWRYASQQPRAYYYYYLMQTIQTNDTTHHRYLRFRCGHLDGTPCPKFAWSSIVVPFGSHQGGELKQK